jgi:ABC-type uncharacterized transport system substrate-binding protein
VNPEGGNILNANTCAVSLDLAPVEYLKILKEAFPGISRVGTVYNPANSLNLIKKMEKDAQQFQIKIIAKKVEDSREISKSIQSLANQIDAFVMFFDPMLLSVEVFQTLVDFSVSNSIPLVVPASALLKQGALLSLEADYSGVGEQVAELANKITDKSVTVSDVGVETPDKTILGVNLKVSELLGIKLPNSLIGKAKYVNK